MAKGTKQVDGQAVKQTDRQRSSSDMLASATYTVSKPKELYIGNVYGKLHELVPPTKQAK